MIENKKISLLVRLESGIKVAIVLVFFAALADGIIAGSTKQITFTGGFGFSLSSLILPALLFGMLAGLMAYFGFTEKIEFGKTDEISSNKGLPTKSFAAKFFTWGMALLLVFVLVGFIHGKVTLLFFKGFKNKELSGWMLNMGEYVLLIAYPVLVIVFSKIISRPAQILFHKIEATTTTKKASFISISSVIFLALVMVIYLVYSTASMMRGADRISLILSYGFFVLLILSQLLVFMFGNKIQIKSLKVFGRLFVTALILLAFAGGMYFASDDKLEDQMLKHAPLYRVLYK